MAFKMTLVTIKRFSIFHRMRLTHMLPQLIIISTREVAHFALELYRRMINSNVCIQLSLRGGLVLAGVTLKFHHYVVNIF